MKQPSEIAEIMKIEMRAKSVSKEEVGSSGRYRYEAVFTKRVVMDRIQDKVELIEEKEGLRLKTVGVEPRLHKTKDSLQSGFSIAITETKSREETENKDLTTFTDNEEYNEE